MTTAGYFDEVDHRAMLAEYPLGDRFLAGPARMSRDELRALQDRRFRAVSPGPGRCPSTAASGGRGDSSRGRHRPGRHRQIADLLEVRPDGERRLASALRRLPRRGPVRRRATERRPPHDERHHGHAAARVLRRPGPGGAEPPAGARVPPAGPAADDVVHSVYGFGMVNGGHYIREALLHFTRCLLLPAGTGLETRSEQQVELMRTFGATVHRGLRRLHQAPRARWPATGASSRGATSASG